MTRPEHSAKMTVSIAVLLAVVMLTPAPAAAQAAADETVLARVGSGVVTVAEVTRLIEGRRLRSHGPAEDRQRVADLLEELIAERLVAEEAHRVSLHDRYMIIVRIRRAVALQAGKLFDEEFLIPAFRIDSLTIDSFYQENISRYTAARDQRFIRHITVPLSGRAVPENYSTYVDPFYEGWEPKRKIDSIYIRLTEGEDFGALARAHSEEPHSKGADGVMGWVSEHSLAPGVFADTCLSLPLHKITRPFASDKGWHIVQVLKMRDAGPVPIDQEIASDIGRLLAKDQTGAFVKRIADSLEAAGTIEVYDAALEIPDDELDPGTPLALVNGRDTIYAAEYLTDKASIQNRFGGGPVTPEQKREVVTGGYYRRAVWSGMLRDQGFLDAPEVQELQRQQEFHEQEGIVRLNLSAAEIQPDSAAITAYYDAHQDEFLNPPQTLRQAWSRIRNTLRTGLQDEARRRRLQTLERRHGVTRYRDRLAAITIPDQL